MNETHKTKPAETSRQMTISDPRKGVIFQIIQASANDNLMPAMKWFTWLISWTIVVGGALAYAIF
jgi:hypothetical protein